MIAEHTLRDRPAGHSSGIAMRWPRLGGLLAMLFAASLASTAVAADQQRQDDALDKQMALFEPVIFFPNLLPVILKNADLIGLTDAQIAKLRAWRDKNAHQLVNSMRQVARARIEFQTAALSSATTAGQLRAFQAHIFNMQRRVLDYKLACRQNIINTFTRDNWENLYFVLAQDNYAFPLPTYRQKVVSLQDTR